MSDLHSGELLLPRLGRVLSLRDPDMPCHTWGFWKVRDERVPGLLLVGCEPNRTFRPIFSSWQVRGGAEATPATYAFLGRHRLGVSFRTRREALEAVALALMLEPRAS